MFNLKKEEKNLLAFLHLKMKNPSFTVNDEKDFIIVLALRTWKHFFDFLMKTRSLKFGEAVKTLAQEAGMEIYRFSKYDKEKEEKF